MFASRFRSCRWIDTAFVLALASCATAQSAESATPAPRTREPVVVAVFGASMSDGFACPYTNEGDLPNRTLRMTQALRGVWSEEVVDFVDKSDRTTFLDPDRQADYVAYALERDPELVIAIDFMFWFGYGIVLHRSDDATARRLRLQRRGFAILETIGEHVPILLGDYPDMNGADNRMIPASAIPTSAQVRALNEALREWAAGRPNVRIFPLSRQVQEMKSGGRRVEVDAERLGLEGGTRSVTLGPRSLLQSDRLHPLRLAMALVADDIAAAVAEMLPPDHALRSDPTFDELLDHCRADGDFDDAFELGYLRVHSTEDAAGAAVPAGSTDGGQGR